MTELPASWVEVPIVELVLPNDNGNPFQQGWSPQCEALPAADGHWGVLKTTAIQHGAFWPHENKALPESLTPRPQIEVKVGDVLMTCAGPRNRCGVACLVEATSPKLMMSGKMYRFRPNPSALLPKYLAYLIRRRESQLAIDQMKTGINDSGLNLTHDRFAKLPVPLPPVPEQHRIVARIEELFSELDASVESLTKARALLGLYRQSLLKAAFQGKLTADRYNHEWPTIRLGDELVFLTSGSRGWADYYTDQGEVFIRAQNLKHDRLDLSEIAYVTPPKSAEGMRTRVQVGDVLITITGANVTKAGIVEHDLGVAYVSQHVALCRCRPNLDPKFLFLYLLSETGGRRQLTNAAYGAGKPGLNLENIREVLVPMPSMPEQRKVVELLEANLSNVDETLRTLEVETTRVAALRQSILKRAFSGRLVPQDPNDEPASGVLARLQSQTATTPARRKRRA